MYEILVNVYLHWTHSRWCFARCLASILASNVTRHIRYCSAALNSLQTKTKSIYICMHPYVGWMLHYARSTHLSIQQLCVTTAYVKRFCMSLGGHEFSGVTHTYCNTIYTYFDTVSGHISTKPDTCTVGSKHTREQMANIHTCKQRTELRSTHTIIPH